MDHDLLSKVVRWIVRISIFRVYHNKALGAIKDGVRQEGIVPCSWARGRVDGVKIGIVCPGNLAHPLDDPLGPLGCQQNILFLIGSPGGRDKEGDKKEKENSEDDQGNHDLEKRQPLLRPHHLTHIIHPSPQKVHHSFIKKLSHFFFPRHSSGAR